MKKKLILVTASVALTACAVFGGTLAWLTSTTNPVTNLFTPSKVAVELTESTGATYTMLPGVADIAKDPKATVKSGSEDCYLFVKLEEKNNYSDWLSHTMADGWYVLDETNHPGVYYRTVPAGDSDQSFSVLQDDKVTLQPGITRAQMNQLYQSCGSNATNMPKLDITAYVVQLKKSDTDSFTPAEAWKAK